MGSGFGITSLLLSIIGLAILFLRIVFLFFFFLGPLAMVLFVLGIIFGIIGIAKDDSKAPGIIGLILGIIGVVAWIAGFILLSFIRKLIEQMNP